MLSHDNLTWTPAATNEQVNGGIGLVNHEDRLVSFLPLSHIAGLAMDLLSSISYGVQVYFARPDAL